MLGQIGEALPFELWRLDGRQNLGQGISRPPSYYIKSKVVITASGVCANAPLLCSLAEFGEDSLMFSVDYPCEDSAIAAQ